MVRSGDHLVLRVGLVFAVLAAGVLATVQTVDYAKYNELRYWGHKVESEERLFIADAFEREKLIDLVVDGQCQARFVNAALSMSLSVVDDTDARLDNAAWKRALAGAQDVATHALTCHPTSGNVWLRLAMIEHAKENSFAAVAGFLRLSQLYAPAERNVLQGRYAQYVRLSDQVLPFAFDPFVKDLTAICSPVLGWRSRTTLPRPGPTMLSAINDVVPNCPPIGVSS